jgi:hypothetical protein
MEIKRIKKRPSSFSKKEAQAQESSFLFKSASHLYNSWRQHFRKITKSKRKLFLAKNVSAS